MSGLIAFALSGAAKTIDDLVQDGYYITGYVVSKAGNDNYTIVSSLNGVHTESVHQDLIATKSEWTCQFERKDDGK